MIARRHGGLPPASGPQTEPDSVRHDGGQPPVVAEVRRDPDLEIAVAPPGQRRGLRQVAADMVAEVKKIGDEQDARGPAGDAAVDPGLDGGSGRLEVARLDDAPGEADAERAGDAAQDPVRGAHSAAMADHEERRAPGAPARPAARPPRAAQRAGHRKAAPRRLSCSTTSISLPCPASSSLTYPRATPRS